MELQNCSMIELHSTESDRMADKQPFYPVQSSLVHEFGSAKFDQPDMIKWMCQWSNFKPLDQLDCTVMDNSI